MTCSFISAPPGPSWELALWLHLLLSQRPGAPGAGVPLVFLMYLALTYRTLPESPPHWGQWEGCDIGPLDTERGRERQGGLYRVLGRPESPGSLSPGTQAAQGQVVPTQEAVVKSLPGSPRPHLLILKPLLTHSCAHTHTHVPSSTVLARAAPALLSLWPWAGDRAPSSAVGKETLTLGLTATGNGVPSSWARPAGCKVAGRGGEAGGEEQGTSQGPSLPQASFRAPHRRDTAAALKAQADPMCRHLHSLTRYLLRPTVRQTPLS